MLDVGRKTRTVPPALRRALDARDRGCRFPGCGLRFTDAHHIVHWADGGETKLENTLLLCRSHHRRVHEGGSQVGGHRDGQVVVFTAQGTALFEAAPPPGLPPDPVQALVRGNRERGITPDWRSGAPRWNRDRDILWAIEAAAMEAIDLWDEPSCHEPSVREPSLREPLSRRSSGHEPSGHQPSVREPSVQKSHVHNLHPTAVSAEIARGQKAPPYSTACLMGGVSVLKSDSPHIP